MVPNITVLLVGGTAETRITVHAHLQPEHRCTYTCIAVESGQEGLDYCRYQVPEVVLLSLLPDMEGAQFLHHLQMQLVGEQEPALIVVGDGEDGAVLEFVGWSIQEDWTGAYLTATRLRQRMYGVVERLQLRRELAHYREQLAALQQANRTLEERQGWLQLLNTIKREHLTDLSQDQTIRRVVEQIYHCVPALRVYYCVLDASYHLDTCLVLPSTSAPEGVMRLNLEPAIALWNWLHTHQPLAVADVEEAAILAPIASHLAPIQVRALLAIPLSQTDGRLGILCLTSDRPRPWSAIEVETMVEIADFLNAALQSALLRVEQRQTEQTLRDHQMLLQLVLDSLPQSIFWKDRHSRFLGCNRQLLLDGGLSSLEDIIGRTDDDMPWAAEASLYQTDDRLVIESGQPMLNIEEPITKAGKGHRWLRTSKVPLRNGNGDIIGVLGIYEDITERKRVAQALEESEARFRAVFEQAAVGVALTDLMGYPVQTNQKMADIMGHSIAALTRQRFIDITHPDDRPLEGMYLQRTLKGDFQAYEREKRYIRPDGTLVWVHVTASLVRDGDARPQYFIKIVQDISDRKRMEIALHQLNDDLEDRIEQRTTALRQINALLQAEIAERRRSEAQVRFQASLLAQVRDAIVAVDLDHRVVYWNPPAERMYGFTMDEAIGRPIAELNRYEWYSAEQEADAWRALQNHGYWQGENIHYRRDGLPIVVNLVVNVLRDDRGHPSGMLAVIRDVTGRKATEARLQEREEMFRKVFDEAPIGMVLVDTRTQLLTRSNQTFQQMLGYTAAELTSKTVDNISHPDDMVIDSQFIQQTLRGEISNYQIEKRFITKMGQELWGRMTATVIRDQHGNFAYGLGMVEDITARREVEHKLRQAELKYRTLVERIPAVVYISPVNRSKIAPFISCRIFDLLQVQAEQWEAGFEGQSWNGAVYPDDRHRVLESLMEAQRTEQSFRAEYRMVTQTGRIVWVQDEAVLLRDEQNAPLAWQGVVIDISDRIQSEDRVRHALREKEVMLKEIHHRVKNNLYIISSLLKLQSGTLGNPQMTDCFRESQSRIRSMALIHEKLYQSPDLSSIHFGDYVRNLCDDIFRSYSTNSRLLTLQVDVKDVMLTIDLAIPCGLLINELLTNSLKYAFPDHSPGTIQVTLLTIPPGDFLLRVADNGVGLPAGFDFRSTRTLGLRLVCNLTQQLNGEITLEGQGGTCFAIRFPNPYLDLPRAGCMPEESTHV